MDIESLKASIIEGYRVSKDEALSLVENVDTKSLCALANDLREHFMGNKFDLCSIVNAKSGKCSENCKWCAQSAHFKTNIDTYDLVSRKEAIELGENNFSQGVKRYSFVTSGRAVSNKDLDTLCEYIEEIESDTDIKVCASMGLLDRERLEKLKDSGVRRYHCNVETSPKNFKNLCTTHTLEDKIETIKICQDLGIEVCSGGIIGMGESMQDRIDMAFLLFDLNIKSIPINILNPIPGTPLESSKPLSDEEILKTIAIFRIINPDSWIRFAGGRLIIKDIQTLALQSGVNAAITGDLLTTTGATIKNDIERIESLGFVID